MALDPFDVRYFKLAVGSVRSETALDVSAKCPICGDSKHSNKARLHLYQKNGVTLVNCFNGGCPCSNRTMYTFLRDFYPQLFASYKKERFKKLLDPDRKGLEGTVIDLGAKIEPKVVEAPKESLKWLFAPLSDQCRAYVEGRGIGSRGIYTAADNITLGGKWYPIKGYVIIPLIRGNEIYGFYTRSPTEKRFFTYIKESYTGFKAWNLFSIDPEKPVFIFEGIFDAMSAQKAGLKNSIALLGAKPSQEILAMLKHPVFCLDNDRTGILNALEYCKKYQVVVWPFEEPKDANEMLQKKIDLCNIITSNLKTGIRATVALRAKL